ncbi:hypothetical protein AURDEDRAFT_122570 [Auricularia subglabra TFB-10046 SS5]|nr:hypothetical protein AURDEDRAFT_122570 [Auricularia subglabra TFB-10046 SS5]
MPCLETLHLSAQRFIWEASEVEPMIPHRLTSFTLLAAHSANVLACVKNLCIPHFHFTSLAGYAALLEDLVRHPLLVRLGICTSEVTQECSSGPPQTVSGDEAVVMTVAVPFVRAHITPAQFSSLAQLSLWEFFWPSANIALPPLPVLRSLRLVLAPCASYSRYWDPPLGILLGFDLSVWDTPALTVLHLDYCPPKHLTCRLNLIPAVLAGLHHSCASTPLIIALPDVYHFVRVCLPRTRYRRLSEITLRGVECVDPDPWPAYGLLKEVADEVAVHKQGEPTQFDIEDQRLAALRRGF